MPSPLYKQLANLLQRSDGTATSGKDLDDTPDIAEMVDPFSSEMHARLLIELPQHRTGMQVAYGRQDLQQLRVRIHKLLGAVVYAGMPELEAALLDLRRALKSADTGEIADRFDVAMTMIDQSLRDD